jgi:hypothetical protein
MDLALGISKIEYGTYGDGIPATSWTEIAENIAIDSVVFNFSEPSEFKIQAEEIDDAVYTAAVKEDVDYVEFALISPSAANMEILAGGTTASEKWSAPTTIPEIIKSLKFTTKTIGTKYYEYTVVRGKIVARISQAPMKQQEEQLLVRVYILAAVTAVGVKMTPFIREKKTAA